MIKEEERSELIIYRIEQSMQTVEEVEVLIKNDLLSVAVNRIYYGMYYILSALALKYQFETSKHLQLIGWFNRSFIKTGTINKKYGKILRDAFKNRTDSDYAPFIEYQKEEVNLMHDQMKTFIFEISDFINKDK